MDVQNVKENISLEFLNQIMLSQRVILLYIVLSLMPSYLHLDIEWS